MRWIAAILLCSLSLAAQPAREQRRSSSRTNDSERGAWIFGSVISDRTGQPLSRAQVILRPVTGTTNSVLAETDERGQFILNRIGPGIYSLMAQRDGYLPNTSARRGPLRLPPLLKLSDGTRLRDLTFRLRPWGVVVGKVRYDDSEPAVGATVQLYRETVARGRRSMQLASSARVNDRGEYRVHGLSPGSYFVSAMRNRPASPDLEEQDAIDESGRSRTEFRYATTFYPSAQKLADAVAVSVGSGDEVGAIDVYLKPVPAVRIRGSITNGLTGLTMKDAIPVFRRVSPDGRSSISVPVNMRTVNLPSSRSGFEITGVTAGPYLVTCEGQYEGRRMIARVFLSVTDAPIDDLDLLLEAEHEITGIVRFDDSPRLRLSNLRVSLEPRTDLNPSRASEVVDDGGFKSKLAPGEHYDAFVANLAPEYYVKSVHVGNVDVAADGISPLGLGAATPLEITLSSKRTGREGASPNEAGTRRLIAP